MMLGPAVTEANADLQGAVTLLTARCNRLQASLDQVPLRENRETTQMNGSPQSGLKGRCFCGTGSGSSGRLSSICIPACTGQIWCTTTLLRALLPTTYRCTPNASTIEQVPRDRGKKRERETGGL